MFKHQVCNVVWKAAQILLYTFVVLYTGAKNMGATRDFAFNTKAKSA